MDFQRRSWTRFAEIETRKFDFDAEKLAETSGLPDLCGAIEIHIAELIEDEARELYRAGTRP